MNLIEVSGKLEQRITTIINSIRNAEELKTLILAQLARDQRGVLVENNPRLPFLLLPLMVCNAICGDYEKALSATAALQLFMAAADILDDIEDQDSDISLCHEYGEPLATNAATALILLAERTLAESDGRVPLKTINQVLVVANSYYLKACAGQHLDLTLPAGKSLSETHYLRVVGLKSASSIENACYIGSLIGGGKSTILARFAKFGYYLGMSSQMNNDIEGITSLKDLAARKVTLPCIFAMKHADFESKKVLNGYFINSSKSTFKARDIYQILAKCGALHYTLIKSVYYKQLALEQLTALKTSGIPTQDFESLVN